MESGLGFEFDITHKKPLGLPKKQLGLHRNKNERTYLSILTELEVVTLLLVRVSLAVRTQKLTCSS